MYSNKGPFQKGKLLVFQPLPSTKTNISLLRNRNIIFKSALGGGYDMFISKEGIFSGDFGTFSGEYSFSRRWFRNPQSCHFFSPPRELVLIRFPSRRTREKQLGRLGVLDQRNIGWRGGMVWSNLQLRLTLPLQGTYPTFGKGTSSSKNAFSGAMWVSGRVKAYFVVGWNVIES